ncbi:heavy-metal-associated domain-containing protein [Flavobacterium agrisoli]|uniref:Heavy-metal-associated domain-containing protein n=1 Tax=Flavobacterium agrisoli TaxID=2793066 RepID=A0A934PL26_9FLAO|nr:heavy-metal-associated domain-containing protein [Flavobacterium agrisoli]MBK0370136.1 heavy-metal-associated domain-containing protein [Flavobacterium agrisoli]
MSLLSENIIPGNHGKIFTTNATKESDINAITKELLKIEGVMDVVFDQDSYPKEFTIHTSKIIEVETIEDHVKNTGFNAIPKGYFAL